MLNDKPTVSTACMYYALTKGKHVLGNTNC